MNTGVPMPAIVLRNHTQLYVAYIISESEMAPSIEDYAVVRFDGVIQYTFGYPNDEALGGHPLYPAGLEVYAFNEVVNSPYVHELGLRNAVCFPGTEMLYQKLRHWIVTFHDETLEVIGNDVSFLGTALAHSAEAAISEHAA